MSAPHFTPGERVRVLGRPRADRYAGTEPPEARGLGRIVEDVAPMPIPHTDHHLYTVELDTGHRRSAGTARLAKVCPSCDGRGWHDVPRGPCGTCSGSGVPDGA